MSDRPLTQVLRRLCNGRVALPAEFRRRLGIDEDALLLLTLRADRIEITPVSAESIAERGGSREVYAMLKLVGREAKEAEEAEISALLDEVFGEARSEDPD